jgi:hypothetical protein
MSTWKNRSIKYGSESNVEQRKEDNNSTEGYSTHYEAFRLIVNARYAGVLRYDHQIQHGR